MRTALYEPTLPVRAGSLAEREPGPDWPVTQVLPAGGPIRWRSKFFAAPAPARAHKRRATRYERFTTRMVLVSSLIMLGVTAVLHGINYDLETKTSSTSGTHGSFYKDEG
ncbi:hypothetical protein ACI1US_01082 [Leucobacter sp. BZR 635]